MTFNIFDRSKKNEKRRLLIFIDSCQQTNFKIEKSTMGALKKNSTVSSQFEGKLPNELRRNWTEK